MSAPVADPKKNLLIIKLLQVLGLCRPAFVTRKRACVRRAGIAFGRGTLIADRKATRREPRLFNGSGLKVLKNRGT